MIGLDTNVLVRYIAQDDARQSAKAAAMIESLSPEAPGFVSVVSLIDHGGLDHAHSLDTPGQRDSPSRKR